MTLTCLATSNDGKELFGVSKDGNKLYKINTNTGIATKFSDDTFQSINHWGRHCAMATDGYFYYLNSGSEIWYMDTNSDSDKNSYKKGNVPAHHDQFYSAVMIQDTLLITSSGYTDAIDVGV